MAESYKILGQINPADTQEYVLYTSQSTGNGTIVTNITATNLSSSAQTFDVNVYNSVKSQASLASSTPTGYVATGFGNTALASYSSDGSTWTTVTLPATTYWAGVAYGNSGWVALCQNADNKAAFSTNGLTWTLTTANIYGYFYKAAYGGGTYIGLDSTGNFTTGAMRSADGINWSSVTLPGTGQNWSGLTYGTKFVALGRNNTFGAYSTDGFTWSRMTLPANVTWQATAYGGTSNLYVALSTSTTAGSSTDGITWTLRTNVWTTNSVYVAGSSTGFVAVQNSGGATTTAAFSTNGITWSVMTMPVSAQWNDVTYGGGKFVAIASNGTSAAYSTNGTTWTVSTNSLSGGGASLASGTLTIPYVSPAVNNVYKTATLQPKASEVLEPGIVLAPNNTLVVRGNTNISFSTYGVELT